MSPVKQSGRRFVGVGIHALYGPWFSCGVHIDIGAPHVALHLLWWQVYIGWMRESTEADQTAALTMIDQERALPARGLSRVGRVRGM